MATRVESGRKGVAWVAKSFPRDPEHTWEEGGKKVSSTWTRPPERKEPSSPAALCVWELEFLSQVSTVSDALLYLFPLFSLIVCRTLFVLFCFELPASSSPFQSYRAHNSGSNTPCGLERCPDAHSYLDLGAGSKVEGQGG